MTTPAASKKDRYGSRFYAIPHPQTRELVDLPSWSTLKKLLYSGGLETWKLKKVAAGVAKSTALQMQAADPDTCYAAVKKALESDTEKADVGTAVHRYTEQIDEGRLDWEYVPESARPYVEHYQQAKAAHGWEVVEQEVTVYNLALGYAGSADRFNRFPGLAERLGLPDPDRDVFCADVKTGGVYTETALQMAAYSNGEGIFVAPSKVDLGFSAREAQLNEWIRTGENVPPGRRKWSADAIREARAGLEAEWWVAYAEHGVHRPMPEGVRTDVGVVIHLTPDGCELIPMRLDHAGEAPGALDVIHGLCMVYRWNARRDIQQPALDAEKEATSGDSPVGDDSAADPVGVQPETSAREDHPSADPPREAARHLRAEAEASVEPLPDGWKPGDPATHADQWHKEAGVEYRAYLLCRPWLQACIDAMSPERKQDLLAAWPEGVPTLKQSTAHYAHELNSIRRAIMSVVPEPTFSREGILPDAEAYIAIPAGSIRKALGELGDGATVTDTEDAPATEADCRHYMEWLSDIADNRAHLLPILRGRLDQAGLRKKLRSDTWTLGELHRWGRVAADVERADMAQQ